MKRQETKIKNGLGRAEEASGTGAQIRGVGVCGWEGRACCRQNSGKDEAFAGSSRDGERRDGEAQGFQDTISSR